MARAVSSAKSAAGSAEAATGHCSERPDTGKKSRKKATAVKVTHTLGELQHLARVQTKQYALAQSTRKSYDGYLKRGRKFIGEVVNHSRKEEASGEGPGGLNVDGNPVDYDKFNKALDGPPNEYSAEALTMFLADQCFVQGNGKSNADAAHAAFKKYWEEL